MIKGKIYDSVGSKWKRIHFFAFGFFGQLHRIPCKPLTAPDLRNLLAHKHGQTSALVCFYDKDGTFLGSVKTRL